MSDSRPAVMTRTVEAIMYARITQTSDSRLVPRLRSRSGSAMISVPELIVASSIPTLVQERAHHLYWWWSEETRLGIGNRKFTSTYDFRPPAFHTVSRRGSRLRHRPVRGHRLHRRPDRRLPGRQRAGHEALGAGRPQHAEARGAARPARRRRSAAEGRRDRREVD